MGFCAVHDYFDVVDSIQLITILVPWVVYFFFSILLVTNRLCLQPRTHTLVPDCSK